jgi:hypothetical protein
MPSAAVDDAFKARLRDSWTGTVVVGGLAAGDPADGPDPPAGVDGFLVVQYPVANAERPVLGRHFFEDGAARLVLNVKNGIGLATGLALADTLAALFRGVKFGGVETFSPSAPIISDTNDDGNWFSFAVIVPYRYQFAG